MKFTKSRVGAIIAAAILAGLFPYLLLFGSVEYESIRERYRRLPFDSRAWQDPKNLDSDDPVRIRMVDDLISSKLLENRTRPEVERLLGDRTNKDYFKEYDLVYWLGPERGFMSIDSEWLVIRFDSSGIVKEYRIVRD